jgi:hypothetical protein
LPKQATEQLAAKLLEVLRGQAHPGGGDEFLDVPLVQRDAVGLPMPYTILICSGMMAIDAHDCGSSSSAPLSRA